MFNLVHRAWSWLTLAGYEKAKDDAAKEIVARFSRGNVAVQNGNLLDEKALEKLSRAGDRAMARLRKKIPV